MTETSLSSACSLRPESSSIKSSSSLRGRGLAEIPEDTDEAQALATRRPYSTTGQEKSEDTEDTLVAAVLGDEIQNWRSDKRTANRQELPQSFTQRNLDKSLPAIPTGAVDEKDTNNIDVDPGDHDLRLGVDRRPSSQSVRPNVQDLHSAHSNKPKAKVGPRPSLDSSDRSRTSGSFSRLNGPRPVSTLPASVRIPVRKKSPARSRSQQSESRVSNIESPGILPLDHFTALPTGTPEMSTSIPSDIIPTSTKVEQPKSLTMTPEKRRLMKALQLRQKQMSARAPAADPQPQLSQSTLALGNTSASTKPEIDGTTLDSSDNISNTTREPDIVHFGTKDFDQEPHLNSESSPLSIPEPSDGPSTQASSITDDEEDPLPESHGRMPETIALSSENETLSNGGPIETIESSKRSYGDKDMINPLQVRQPPTPRSIRDSVHVVCPHEVPLPPISEDEELSLRPQQETDKESNITHAITHSGIECLGLSSASNSQSRIDTEDFNMSRPSTADTVEHRRAELRARRRGWVDPIRTLSSPEDSDDNFLSDDSFLEELKSATVQEAKPISVSKSPITPVFPRPPSEKRSSEVEKPTRVVSSPLHGSIGQDQGYLFASLPSHTATRSFSTSTSPIHRFQQASVPLSKKASVSSGISQRIKALELLSSRETSPVPQSPPSATPAGASPAFSKLRESSLQTHSARPDLSKSIGHKGRRPAPYPSSSPSPEASPPNQRVSSIYTHVGTKPGRSQPESISVTATIIRDAQNQNPAVPLNPSEPQAMNLHHSPLMVEHQATGNAPPKSLQIPPNMHNSNNQQDESTLSQDPKPEPFPTGRRGSSNSKISDSSRKEGDADFPRSTSETSSNGFSGPDVPKEERKESRKSRLLKRMSSISSASRRSLVHALSPSVKEQPIIEHHEVIPEALPAVVNLGDVNIQFPYTLVRPPHPRDLLVTLIQASSSGNGATCSSTIKET